MHKLRKIKSHACVLVSKINKKRRLVRIQFRFYIHDCVIISYLKMIYIIQHSVFFPFDTKVFDDNSDQKTVGKTYAILNYTSLDV